MGSIRSKSWNKNRGRESLSRKVSKGRYLDLGLPKLTLKTFAVLWIVIVSALVIGVGSTVPNNPFLTHYQVPNPAYQDPIVPIYHFCNSNKDLGRFTRGSVNNFRFATVTVPSCGNDTLNLQSNSTASAFAIDTQPMQLSPVSGHHLQINFAFAFYNQASVNQPLARMFLTLNKTAPLEKLVYVPETDPNVVFMQTVFPSGAGANSFTINTYIQGCCLNGATIHDQDSGCGSGGSPFICGSNVIVGGGLGTILSVYTTLNFTGVTSSQTLSHLCVGSAGCAGPPAPLTDNTQFQLPRKFYSGTLYWGLEQDKQLGGISNAQIGFWDNVDPVATGPSDSANHWLTAIWNPPALISPTLDETAFLGFDIRSILGIGSIVSGFFNTAWNSLVSVTSNPVITLGGEFINGLINLVLLFAKGFVLFMDTIGQAVGFGTVGTAMSQFFTNMGNWIATIVGRGFSQISNAVSQATNILLIIENIFGPLGNPTVLVTMFTNFLINVGSIISPLIAVFNDSITLFGSLAQFTTYFFFMWYVFILYRVYFNGHNALMEEFNTMERAATSLFRITWWFIEASWDTVLAIKQLIVDWM